MSEYDLQKFTVTLLRLQAANGVIFFHPPNGEYRSGRTGARLKAMGVRPGVADIVVVLPGARVCFLELKAPKNYQSKVQREFEDDCVANGAPYAVAKTPEQVKRVLTQWGALRAAASLARAA